MPLSDADTAAIAAQFDVGPAQIERDHAISHVLAALSRSPLKDQVVFFGGTALTRTFLPDLRLSEDIDLIAQIRRSQVAQSLPTIVNRALARSHGAVSWTPPLDRTSGSEPVVMAIDRIRIQVQVVSQDGYNFPTELREIEQRYSDAPEARLRVPTAEGFVRAKTEAWRDRKLPRDLYDLWALASNGFITVEATDLYVRTGPTGKPPDLDGDFGSAPNEEEWRSALGHQCRLQVTAAEALAVVRAAWKASMSGS